MSDDPLDAVYSYVERAYVRLQAGDLLLRCIEEGSTDPIQQIVESFVLAGPQSLDTLREILAEAAQRKSQVYDDLNQIYNQLEENLKSYGVQLGEIKGALGVTSLTPIRFLAMLREQGVVEEDQKIACLQVLKDARELMLSLAEHLQLFEEVEKYLADWLWVLAYQSVRQNKEGNGRSPSRDLSL